VTGPLLATSTIGEIFGTVALALAVSAWLLTPRPRLRAAAGLAVLALAPLALLASVTGDSEASLPHLSAAVLAALSVATIAAVIMTAAAFVRFPRAVMPAALIALPFRVPLALGGESVKLLLPLYLVIAGAVVAYAWQAWHDDAPVPRSPRLLDVSLAVFLGLYALQTIYSPDTSAAAQNSSFFYAPFALLYGIAASQRWDARQLRACAAALVAVALVLVAAGFVEFARGEPLLRPGGIKPNDFDPYPRVQSLFFDPNIFGRFVAVVMITVAAVLVFTEKPVRVVATAVLLALLWAGLVMTLSQSSFAALLAGLIALAALRWNSRVVLGASGIALLAGAVFVVAFPAISKVDLSSSRSAERSTSGRFDLVTGGIKLFGDRPLWGYGSGGFSDAFDRKQLARDSAFGSPTTTKSHTSPLTVAAEQGLIGLAAFMAVLIAGFAAVFRRARPDDDRPGYVARIAIAAAFTALFVHSLAYAAFLEDPLTWVMLGTAISLAAIPRNGHVDREATA
jgi:O-antigen ligase